MLIMWNLKFTKQYTHNKCQAILPTAVKSPFLVPFTATPMSHPCSPPSHNEIPPRWIPEVVSQNPLTKISLQQSDWIPSCRKPIYMIETLNPYTRSMLHVLKSCLKQCSTCKFVVTFSQNQGFQKSD